MSMMTKISSLEDLARYVARHRDQYKKFGDPDNMVKHILINRHKTKPITSGKLMLKKNGKGRLFVIHKLNAIEYKELFEIPTPAKREGVEDL